MSASWGELLIGTKQGGATVGGVATGAAFDCPGGVMVFAVTAAAWNVATVALYVLGPDGVTWIVAGPNTTLTANGLAVVYLAAGQVQAQVSAGPPTGVFATLSRVVQ